MRETSPGSWSYYVTVRNAATGERRKEWKRFHGSFDDAKLKRAGDQVAAAGRTSSDLRGATLEEYGTYWLDTVAKLHVKPSTFRTYSLYTRGRLARAFGKRKLEDLSASEIQRQYAAWLEEGLSPTTVRHLHVLLGLIVRHAQASGAVAKTPFDNRKALQPPAEAEYVGLVWNPEQMRVALDALTGTWLHLPALIAMTTGMRRGEILALREQDLRADSATVWVDWSLHEDKGTHQLVRPKSKSSRRSIDVPISIIEQIQDLMRQQKGNRTVPHGLELRSLVVVAPDGGFASPSLLSGRWADWVRKVATVELGLPKVRFHDLRHSHATALLERGVDLKLVSQRLGHSSVGITARRYAHVTGPMRRAAIEEVEGMFSRPVTDLASTVELR